MLFFFQQATSKVEIDPEAVEKLKITMADFRHALQNDVKPVCFYHM
jgi:vesicle-fusing ATPase